MDLLERVRPHGTDAFATGVSRRCAPSVTLAVLTYNGRKLLDATLPSVLAQRCEGELRVLVVDDGSSDGTAEHLRRRWPEVEVLALEDNVGVTAALNRAVQATNTDFVALLNNDVELAPDWLAQLTATLEAHPEAATACGKLLRYHEPDRIDAAGDVLLRCAAGINRGAGEVDRGQYDEPEPVFGASAAAALYRRSAFDVVGTFDESFCAYLEDVDWSMRAQLAGFSARYEPAAVGYHMGGATTQRDSGRFVGLSRRNQLLLIAKTLPAGTLVRHGWRIAIHLMLVLAGSVLDGCLRQTLRAWADAVCMLPGALRRRRHVRATRRVAPREVERVMAAGVPPILGALGRVAFELAPCSGQLRIAAASAGAEEGAPPFVLPGDSAIELPPDLRLAA